MTSAKKTSSSNHLSMATLNSAHESATEPSLLSNYFLAIFCKLRVVAYSFTLSSTWCTQAVRSIFCIHRSTRSSSEPENAGIYDERSVTAWASGIIANDDNGDAFTSRAGLWAETSLQDSLHWGVMKNFEPAVLVPVTLSFIPRFRVLRRLTLIDWVSTAFRQRRQEVRCIAVSLVGEEYLDAGWLVKLLEKAVFFTFSLSWKRMRLLSVSSFIFFLETRNSTRTKRARKRHDTTSAREAAELFCLGMWRSNWATTPTPDGVA